MVGVEHAAAPSTNLREGRAASSLTRRLKHPAVRVTSSRTPRASWPDDDRVEKSRRDESRVLGKGVS